MWQHTRGYEATESAAVGTRAQKHLNLDPSENVF